ncbi:MAG: isocitrate/isopropylmalate dehydrogenase family protein [Elusimicrobiota bacterium]
MTKKIAVIPGDGVGSDVIEASMTVLKTVTDKLEYSYFEAGYDRFIAKGESITDELLEDLKNYSAILFGAVGSPSGVVKNYRSAVLTMRRHLDLYANIRPVKSYIKDNKPDVVIFRENTEGLYIQKEYMRGEEAVSEKVVTEAKTRRIAKAAYSKAREWGRKRVSIVQKSNVLRLTDGMFRDVCREVAKDYPEIETDEKYIDNACYQLVRNPSSFDVIVTTNLYGDILGDLAGGVADGLGFAPSGQIGDKLALFEPVHGSAPKYVGMNKVNPIATILSAKMMLDYLGMAEEADAIEKAIVDVLKEGKVRTYDIGGVSTTTDMADAIAEKISSGFVSSK